MVDIFCTKYFHREETVTLATLQATKQRSGEDLMEYIKRFSEIALEGRFGKLRDLPVCTVVTKGHKDCLICKTKRKQKKCSAGYGSIYW